MIMPHLSYTDPRRNLARSLDETVRTGTPIVVTRRAGRGNVVMLSEAEFEAGTKPSTC